MAEAVDKVAAVVASAIGAYRRRLGGLPVGPRHRADGGGAVARPSMFGRVAIAQTMRDVSPDLMDIARHRVGAADRHRRGRRRRCSGVRVPASPPLVGIYGGTLEVFRNMIAQHVLGTGQAELLAAGQKGVVTRHCAPHQ